MSFTLKVPPELEVLQTQQDRVLSVRQLIEHGFNSSAISRRLRNGVWQRLLPSVVLTASGSPTRRQLLVAAYLAGGEESAIDGFDACAWHRLVSPRHVDSPVQLVVPWGSGARSGGFLAVRRTIAEIPIGGRGIIPYVDIPTALIVAARSCRSSRDAIGVLARGLQLGRVTVEQLQQAREQIGAKWCSAVDAALVAVGVGVHSPAERDNRDLILTSRVLPEPLWNQWLDLGDGGPQVCADALFVDAGMVDEVNGRRYHAWGEAFERTEERRARIEAAGLAVSGCTAIQLRRQPAAVLERKERTYARYAGRGMPSGVRLLPPPALRASVASATAARNAGCSGFLRRR